MLKHSHSQFKTNKKCQQEQQTTNPNSLMVIKRINAPQRDCHFNSNEQFHQTTKLNKRQQKQLYKQKPKSIFESEPKLKERKNRKEKAVSFCSHEECHSFPEVNIENIDVSSTDKKKNRKRRAQNVIEAFFSSPMPSLLKSVWQSFNGTQSGANSKDSSSLKRKQECSTASCSTSCLTHSSKSSNSHNEPKAFAKPFSPSVSHEQKKPKSQSYREKLRNSSKKRPTQEVIPFKDEMTGKHIDFNLYLDKDLPFLDPNKEENKMVTSNIIDGDQDDDCQTDDEQQKDAKEMLKGEVGVAIARFLSEMKDGTTDCFIKNYNTQKRFAKPF